MQEVKNDKKLDENQASINQAGEVKENEESLREELETTTDEKITGDTEKKQIYLVELFFIFPILVVADIIDIFSLTGIGAVLSWAMDLVATGVTTLWLWWKGRRVEWNLVANLLEFIPVVDVLPIRTVTMIILLVLDRKRGKQLASKITGIIDKNKISKIKK